MLTRALEIYIAEFVGGIIVSKEKYRYREFES